VLGRSITLSGRAATIVGVISTPMSYPLWADMWRPISAIVGTDAALSSRHHHTDSRVIARLRPGVVPSAVMAELAIGATSRNLTGLVLQQGVALAGVGVLVGVVAGAAVTRALRASIDSALFRTSPFALVPTLSAAVILVGVTVAATWLPARRAARTNPLLILRAEE
jgi:hypothetical protein